MKISFTTPLKYTDGTDIASAALAAATYTLFIDTVNPPVKTYSVPPANVALGVKQTDGSVTVTVDAVKDLGITVVPGTPYFIAAEDFVTGAPSPETTVISYTYSPTPEAPRNFSVA